MIIILPDFGRKEEEINFPAIRTNISLIRWKNKMITFEAVIENRA